MEGWSEKTNFSCKLGYLNIISVALRTALWCFHISYAKASDDKAVRKEETMIELNRVVYDEFKVSSPNPNNK